MIKGIIFDLDNCIFDTRSMGEDLIDPVLAAMADDNDISSLQRDKIKQELWSMSLADVIRSNNISEKIAGRMHQAYIGLDAPDNSRNYEDVSYIEKSDLVKILVTSGYRNFQLSKIRKTGIEPYFNEIIVDAIDKPAEIKGKQKIFAEVAAKYGWQNTEALVIGDSPASELAAGKALGMVTVQILRPGIIKADGFDHYIKNLFALDEIMEIYN
jgi:FMN phosphatase YigB (HAD superfamily)